MSPTESTIAFLVYFALLAWGFSWIWTIKYRDAIRFLNLYIGSLRETNLAQSKTVKFLLEYNHSLKPKRDKGGRFR